MFPLEDPVLVFTVLALMIFLAPLIARHLRVPDLVLLLAGGALLGPNGIGVLERNSAIVMLGSIGLLYIMFIAGLETDLNHFMRTRNRSIVFGLLTFSIPQLAGTAAGHYLLGFNWTASILLASMFASHTLLAYPIVSRLGLARREPVVITVGGTIITDTLALLVLAVVADSVKGAELGIPFWLMLAFGICGLIFLVSFGVPMLTRWFFKNVTESGGAQFLFVIVMVCGCAYLSHFAKMEPIIGAFLVGAAFSRLIPEQSALMNRLLFVGNTLFIPFFLVSVGMLVDVKVMASSPRSWLVAATMVCAVIVTKYAAAELTRRIYGYAADAGKVMFGLSVVQAAATLAAVIVGYNLGIFDETVLNGAIFMILVTCPLGAWTADRYGRRLIDNTPDRPETVSAEQRVMVSISKADAARRLLDLAFLIRDAKKRGKIYPVTIVSDIDNTDAAVARGEKLLASCLTESAAAEIEVTPSVKVDLNPSDGLIRAAKELRATLVMAEWSRKRPLSARFFGSVSEKLIASCASRLLFCRLVRPLNITRRVLAPFPVSAGRRTDLSTLIHNLKQLSHQVGAGLRIYLVSGESNGLRQKITAARPNCPLEIVEAETWNGIQTQFLADIGPHDLILLPQERRSGLFWTPAMDKLQETAFARFPENNLLSIYPPLLPESGEEIPFDPPAGRTPRIVAVDIPPDLDEKAGLRRMVRAAFTQDGYAFDDVMPLLEKAMDAYPLELAEHIAIVHAHSESVFAPVIIVGKAEREWRFRNLPGSYRLLLVLVSPKPAPPELHMKILADLAHRFLDPRLQEEVRGPGPADEIARQLAPR